jgi:L,D-transpeptidase YcbB
LHWKSVFQQQQERVMTKTSMRYLAGAAAAAAVLLTACGPGEPDVLPGEVLQLSLAGLPADSVLELATGDTVHISASTAEFYAGRGYAAAWAGSRDLLDRGHALHEAIGRADEDGLNPARYGHDVASRMLAALAVTDRRERLPDSVAVRYLAEVDVLLTEGMGRYAHDLVTGTLDPAEAGIEWQIRTEVPYVDVVLNNLVNGREPQEVVAHLRPSIPYYERMRAALAQYRSAAEAGGWPEVPSGETLKEGERNEAVALLRQRFVRGADRREAELAAAGAADPTHFDESLKEAVQHFQRRHSIEADGAVGRRRSVS